MKIVCLVLPNTKFDNQYNDKVTIEFINIISDTFLHKGILFVSETNKDNVLLKALKYVHNNIKYDYILVIYSPHLLVETEKFEDEHWFRHMEGTCKLRGKYDNHDYFLLSNLDLKIKFHKKYVQQNSNLLDKILEDVILPFEKK